MKPKTIQISLLLLSMVLFISVSTASGTFQSVSNDYLTDTLKKASLAFAGARTINALVSVAQKIETGGSVKLLGTGGSAAFAPFEWLDPVNDLVERFSLIMLASCVAVGILLFLNHALPWLSLAVLLPTAALLLLSAVGIRTSGLSSGRRTFRTGYKLLVITAITAAMIPLMTAVDYLTYSFFLEDTYESAVVSMETVQHSLAPLQEEKGMMDRIEALQQQAGSLKARAEGIINHILDLIIVFLVQTILLPLFVFWLLIKLMSRIGGSSGPLPAESLFT